MKPCCSNSHSKLFSIIIILLKYISFREQDIIWMEACVLLKPVYTFIALMVPFHM